METGAEFEEWVNLLPEVTRQRDGLWVACRAAARSLPLLWQSQDAGTSMVQTSLPELRCLLTAQAVVRRPTSEVKNASGLARSWLDGVGTRNNDAARAVRFVARGGAAARVAVDAADASEYSVEAIVAAFPNVRRSEVWQQIQLDTTLVAAMKDDGLTHPLWFGDQPDWFDKTADDMRRILAKDPNIFKSFWLKWWDRLVSGKPFDLDFHAKVVCIPDQVWRGGPDKLTRWFDYLIQKEPLLLQMRILRAKLVEMIDDEADLGKFDHNGPPTTDEEVAKIRANLVALRTIVEELELEFDVPAPLTEKLSALVQKFKGLWGMLPSWLRITIAAAATVSFGTFLAGMDSEVGFLDLVKSMGQGFVQLIEPKNADPEELPFINQLPEWIDGFKNLL